MRKRYWLAGFALCLLAALQWRWVGPQLLRLPADYADEISYDASSRYRDSPTGPWTRSRLVARRVDQTLLATADRSVIQGDLHWTDADGVAQYETSNVFGVDRHTRANLPDSGNARRTGAYLFPRHTQPRTYVLWDPQYVGPRTARFEEATRIDGLRVYRFSFTASNLDETAGYLAVPGIPERYRAFTDGQGRMWIEPTSGVVVDYEERGNSFFVDVATGRRLGDFYQWTDRLSAPSRAAKLAQARAGRRRILWLEYGLPGMLALAGLGCFAFGLRIGRAGPAATVDAA